MSWMMRMERKYGKYAIHNLMLYVIVLYAVGAVLRYVAPNVLNWLVLDFGKVLHGQIWRLITFVITPMYSNILSTLIMLYCYYLIGRTLEQLWGAFRFNLYFLMGIIFNIIGAAIIYVLFGDSLSCGATFLNLSLFFAFVTEFPNAKFLLFFIIPIKAKWLGYLNAIYFAVIIIVGLVAVWNPMISFQLYYRVGILTYPSYAVAALVSVLNYVVFYFMCRRAYRRPAANKKMRKEFRAKAAEAQRVEQMKKGEPRHRCAVCGRTELDDPNLEFRFCSKCQGSYEYCMDHLYTHKHVIKNP